MPQTEPTVLAAEVLEYREVHQLPGDWGPESLSRLLADLEVEFEGADAGDLEDLVSMALGDLDPHEAGIAVLRTVFGDGMSAGSRANLAADLTDDRPWEEFADLSRQAGIFSACVLLQRAFPRLFGKPDATAARVAFRAQTAADARLFAGASPAVVLRALAPGLGPGSIVTRLYGEGLHSGPFPEAEHILWRRRLQPDPADPRLVIAELHGAQSFLGALDRAEPWQARVKLHAATG